MSPQGSASAHDLTRFVGLLRELDEAGIEYVVIGGCAVGAYARLGGEAVFSADLDLYLSEPGLDELLSWAREQAVTIEKLPQPRSVPVAVLRDVGPKVVPGLSRRLASCANAVVIPSARLFIRTTAVRTESNAAIRANGECVSE